MSQSAEGRRKTSLPPSSCPPIAVLNPGRRCLVVTHNRICQNIGGLSFLFMYAEKFLKRVFPPTPKRMANKSVTCHRTPAVLGWAGKPAAASLFLSHCPADAPSIPAACPGVCVRYYKIYKYVATFTTIFVVIITAGITKGLYARGIKIPIVGDLPAGREGGREARTQPTHSPSQPVACHHLGLTLQQAAWPHTPSTARPSLTDILLACLSACLWVWYVVGQATPRSRPLTSASGVPRR